MSESEKFIRDLPLRFKQLEVVVSEEIDDKYFTVSVKCNTGVVRKVSVQRSFDKVFAWKSLADDVIMFGLKRIQI
jgi:hypothetical protein